MDYAVQYAVQNTVQHIRAITVQCSAVQYCRAVAVAVQNSVEQYSTGESSVEHCCMLWPELGREERMREQNQTDSTALRTVNSIE